MKLSNLKIKRKHVVELLIEDENEFLPLEVKSEGDIGYGFYINGIRKELNTEQQNEIVVYIRENIDQNELELVIANEDYDKIFNKLSISDMLKGWKYDTEMIHHVIDDTMDVFIKHEHYEKCEVLNKIKKQI